MRRGTLDQAYDAPDGRDILRLEVTCASRRNDLKSWLKVGPRDRGSHAEALDCA